jgi:sugar phosphate isomerase/epimerase
MITVFSKHLHWLDVAGMAQTAADIGFDGVDLTIRPRGHVIPERVEDELPKAVEECKKAGIEIAMICTTIQDASEPLTEKILKTASQSGIKYYRMNWYHYDPKKSIEKNLEYFTAKMKDLAQLNKHYQIKGAYQNHDGTWFGAPVWDLGLILHEIDSKWLGSQYDILNASIEGTYSWPLAFNYIAPYVHTIDIKDARWNKKAGEWHLEYVPLGDGNVDFLLFFKLLQEHNIDVPYSMHFEYDLGGAEIGAHHLTIPEEEVIKLMKKDLNVLKSFLGI